MATLLIFGFLLGARHALEADHVAAVASLASRVRSPAEAVWHGMAWGIGHSVTLFVVGSLVLPLDFGVPSRVAALLELLAGAALLALGIDVLRRLVRDRVHVHRHDHDDGESHIHAHSHAEVGPRHSHLRRLPIRTLMVGLVHGVAGSAALVVLTASTVDSFATAIVYVTLFGLGSMVGMAALSAAIAVPLRAASNSLTWLHNGLKG